MNRTGGQQAGCQSTAAFRMCTSEMQQCSGCDVHVDEQAGLRVLACFRACGLRERVTAAIECACRLARAEQRQVLIPMMSRDTMRRVVVWVSGRGWAEDGSCYSNSRPCVSRSGGPMTFIFSETLSHYGTKLSYFFSWSASREAMLRRDCVRALTPRFCFFFPSSY